jgi:hypothetical protein
MSNIIISENPISPKTSTFSIASLITCPLESDLQPNNTSSGYDYNHSFDYQQIKSSDLLTASTNWFQRHFENNIKNMEGGMFKFLVYFVNINFFVLKPRLF